MLGQRCYILVLLCFVHILKFRKVVATLRAAPRSKGESILTRVKSIRRWENRNDQNEGQTSQNHRRVPKGGHSSHHSSYLGCLGYSSSALKKRWIFNSEPPACKYVHHGSGGSGGSSSGSSSGGSSSSSSSGGSSSGSSSGGSSSGGSSGGSTSGGNSGGSSNGGSSSGGSSSSSGGSSSGGDSSSSGSSSNGGNNSNGNGGDGDGDVYSGQNGENNNSNGNNGNGNNNSNNNNNNNGGQNGGNSGNGNSNDENVSNEDFENVNDDSYQDDVQVNVDDGAGDDAIYSNGDGDNNQNNNGNNQNGNDGNNNNNNQDGGNGNNQQYDPFEDFDIAQCDTFENLWLWDLSLTCESETNLDSCECVFAEELISSGYVQCDDRLKCPSGCQICTTCFQLMGCDSGNKFRSSAGFTYLILTILSLLLCGAGYYYFRVRHNTSDLSVNLIVDGSSSNEPRIWLSPVKFADSDVDCLESTKEQDHVWLAPELSPIDITASQEVVSSEESVSSTDMLLPCPVGNLDHVDSNGSGDRENIWLAPITE